MGCINKCSKYPKKKNKIEMNIEVIQKYLYVQVSCFNPQFTLKHSVLENFNFFLFKKCCVVFYSTIYAVSIEKDPSWLMQSIGSVLL